MKGLAGSGSAVSALGEGVETTHPDRDPDWVRKANNLHCRCAVEVVRSARDRGYGVIFFYWECLWGRHVPEQQRIKRFRDLQSLGFQT